MARALRLFPLSVCAGASYPDSSLVLFVSETKLADLEDLPADRLEIEVLRQQVEGFGSPAESAPAFVATRDVVCRNRRMLSRRRQQSIEQ
jgi:hypothetical protein